jgi:hypothetical protein
LEWKIPRRVEDPTNAGRSIRKSWKEMSSMFNIGDDYHGYFVNFRGANINNRLAEQLDISIRKFNGMVRKNNGTIEKSTKDAHGQCYTHRFRFIADCENFIRDLEPFLMINKITN